MVQADHRLMPVGVLAGDDPCRRTYGCLLYTSGSLRGQAGVAHALGHRARAHRRPARR